MKNKLRKEILEKRNGLSFDITEQKSNQIIDKLRQDTDFIVAKTIMFYVSKGKEVHTHNLIKEVMKDKKILVPKVTDKGLLCCELPDFDKMDFSCFGVLEPTDDMTCDVSEIDLIIVPGVAFDKRGHRIGYGMGYYDKLLKNAKCPKIGLAYNFQLVERIPNDEWDVSVDRVISD